jgi:chaperonin GroES
MGENLRPLNTRLIVRPDDPESRSKGGIIIPDQAKEKPVAGTLVAKGPGMLMRSGARWPMPEVEAGDRVVYSQYAGVELEIEGKIHIVLRDDDLFLGGPDPKSLRPMADRIVVRKDKAAEMSKGGIIIPDSAKEKVLSGEVIAVGRGKVLEDGVIRPLDVKVGDMVKFARYQGTDVLVGGEKFTVFREDDLLGVVELVEAPILF